MTDFTTYEYSQRASHAIYLYDFSDGTTNWRYCSGTETVFSFGGNSYTPAAITHGEINLGQNTYDEKIEIEASTGLGIVADNIARFQSAKIWLHIYKIQNNEAALYKRIWYGSISDFVYNDQTTKIMVESLFAALNKRVVKNVFSYQCRHILYGTACGLVANDHKTNGVISGISGTSISAAIFNTGVPGTFLSSMITTQHGESRVIVEDLGAGTVKIIRPFEQAIVTTTFYVLDKCGRTLADCIAHSNSDNFGGFPYWKNNAYSEGVDEGKAAILTNPIT